MIKPIKFNNLMYVVADPLVGSYIQIFEFELYWLVQVYYIFAICKTQIIILLSRILKSE